MVVMMHAGMSYGDPFSDERFVDAKWEADDKPIVVLDGQPFPIRNIKASITGDAAYVIGVNQASFTKLCESLRATKLRFYEMRVSDLSLLRQIGDISHLAIEWNTKLTDLSPISFLKSLRLLKLVDTPKAQDLSPIQDCQEVRHIEFSGGIWNKNTAANLASLASLPELRSLILLNLKLDSGGLRPLAGCKKLEQLTLSNQFPTEDYAYLSVCLPNTQCDMFAPYVPISKPIDGNDVMVVGRRKPFLNSKTDKQRIEKYAATFKMLQEQFAAER